MKLFPALLLLLLSATCFSQRYSVKWGEEIKLKKGSLDFDVINADETGVYVVEGKLKMKTYFVVGATFGTSHKLIKFDRNYQDVYERDYKQELDGLSFNSIRFLRKEMYLFASDYLKKEKKYIVYGVRLDRMTGLATGKMQELASFQLDSKKDDFEYSLVPNADSTAWMLIGDVSTDKNAALSITLLDRQLTRKGTTAIGLSYEPKSFTLEDVLLTADNKFLLVGRQFEQVPTGKRNKTVRTFTKYVFSKYDANGRKEADLPTDVNAHYAVNGKALFLPGGELCFAGFYSDDAKKKTVNGVFFHRLDLNGATVRQSSYKAIAPGMLDQAQEDENEMDDDQKKQRKERKKDKDEDEEEGISKDFVIRGVEYNPQNQSLLLIAELSTFRMYTTTTYTSNFSPTGGFAGGRTTTTTTYQYVNSDLLVINAAGNGEIAWINTLPKKQVETIRSSSSAGPGISFSSDPTSLFARGGGMPFYSSFASMMYQNKLIFLINDHQQNSHVEKLGDKVKAVSNFRSSAAYAVSLDLITGRFTRKVLLNNEDDPVLMPRFGFIVGKEIYLPAMKMKALGKTEFKIGKISVL
ncbi:hypothetical protein V9K67_03825 [Paraflavisolibacter sp. H34]|uniref:hypothetical protein n=1 Tax=Huijunlia imazamoxiresistens TaxID=3127457 RepID=UPI003016FC55